jgi:hypothetical protein
MPPTGGTRSNPEFNLGDPLGDDKYTKNYPKALGRTMGVRLDVDQERGVDIAVASEDTPWKTHADFFRYATREALDDLARNSHNPKLIARVALTRANDQAADHVDLARQTRQWLDDVNTYIGRLLLDGDLDEVHRALGEYYGHVKRLTIPQWHSSRLKGLNALPAVRLAIPILLKSGFGYPAHYDRGIHD